jgi:8-oxo-dGTP pyrophosphatase MutT (NUDIX family)
MFETVPDYFFIQSGVIPYRIKGDKLEILLITSRSKKNWIIPKGVKEPYMTPHESAQQEAYEEAGIIGKIEDEPVGMYEVEKWGGVCSVTVYPMLVEKEYDDWTEKDFRQRKWMGAKEAAEKVSKKSVAKLLKKFYSSKRFKNLTP